MANYYFMIFTSHALAGAAIGIVSGNPYAGFASGVISHHLLDMIPHFDQGTFRLKGSLAPYINMHSDFNRSKFNGRDWIMLFIDFAITGVLFLIISATLPVELWPLVFCGALGGLAPDLIGTSPLWSDQLEKKFKSARIYKSFHGFFHFTVSPSLIWLGVVTQILVIGFSLIIIAGK